jgi:hypothetical protein
VPPDRGRCGEGGGVRGGGLEADFDDIEGLAFLGARVEVSYSESAKR